MISGLNQVSICSVWAGPGDFFVVWVLFWLLLVFQVALRYIQVADDGSDKSFPIAVWAMFRKFGTNVFIEVSHL